MRGHRRKVHTATGRIREGFLEEVAGILHGQRQAADCPFTEVYILENGESPQRRRQTEKELQTYSSIRASDI